MSRAREASAVTYRERAMTGRPVTGVREDTGRGGRSCGRSPPPSHGTSARTAAQESR